MLCILALSAQYVKAQTDTLQKDLGEVIIYANKFAEKKQNLSQKVDLISSNTIAQTNAQNTGDLLINTGKLFVQKSQQGGSSPVIRGFEASRILLVVDGVRMNNAIYRSGHLQNVITVDQNMLERVEVLFGPSSTLYGSDALGGVLHFHTKKPFLSGGKNFLAKQQAFARYSSANNEKTLHYNGSLGGKKIAWLQSYTYSDFGDMRMGDNYPSKYPDFGRRSRYIETINGIDSVVTNQDDRIQKFSGYKQWDVTQKILFKPSDKISHLINFQYSNSTDIPRYDRLQDVRNGTLRFAEWYYGPQKRILSSYELSASGLGPFDEFKLIGSYQKIKESRHTREYRRYTNFDNRIEKLDVWGLTVDGRKIWNRHELITGIDMQFNKLSSTAYRINLLTGNQTGLDSRYPDGDNHMNYAAVYGQHIFKITENKLVLNSGIRLQYVKLNAALNNNYFNLPYTSINQHNSAITGNFGVVYLPVSKFKIALNTASGFRAPNIDDLAKIFESSTSARRVIFPNPGIKPEYTYNIDMNVEADLKSTRATLAVFYTWFDNAISLSPYSINGDDSILYNGVKSAIYANQNTNSGRIYGFQASAEQNIGDHLKLNASIAYTYGRLKDDKKKEIPADHIPPVYGKAGLDYSHTFIQFSFYTIFNGWKRIKDYNPGGEDNQQYATPDGMPAWYTLNFKSSINIGTHLQLQAGIENILDRNYRYFASGFSAAGRNIIFALRASF